MDNIDDISPNGETTFNIVAADALLPNIKKILSHCHIRQGYKRFDCLLLLLRHLMFCSEEETIMLQAYALQLIMKYPKVNGHVIKKNIRYPNYLLHRDISTLESSKAFISEVEAFLNTSLASCYGTSNRDESRIMRCAMTDERPLSSSMPQMTEEFDWSQPISSSSNKRQHSSNSLELVCCHPQRRQLTTSQPLPEDLSSSTDCQCIHCFLHDSFPTTYIERSLIALNPSDLGNNIFFSFDLSYDEVNSIRQGNLRVCMYVAHRFGDEWILDSSRFRMIMNGVDVFSTQSIMVKNQYFLDKLARVGKNSCSIYYTMSPYIYLAFYLVRVLSVTHFIEEFEKKPAPSIDQSKSDFFSLIDDDDDIDVDESLRYSLLDPLSKLRMDIPVRSVKCDHLPCFDLKTFLDMYSTKEKMLCPVCYQPILLEDLKRDWFVDRILKETKEDDDEVSINKDGTWEIIERSEKDSEEEESEKEESEKEHEDDIEHSLERIALETLQSLPTSRMRLSREPSIRRFYKTRSHIDQAYIQMTLPMQNTSDYSVPSLESESHIPSPNRSKGIQNDTIIDLVSDSDSDSSQDIRQSHHNSGNNDIIDISDYTVC